MNQAVRNVLFTIFEEEGKDNTGLNQQLLENHTNGSIKYAIYQIERCPTTQRRHYQGYIELSKPNKFPAIKRILGRNDAHLDKRNGSREQARDYCSKLDTRVEGPFEYGDFGVGGQGQRSDLQRGVDIITRRLVEGDNGRAALKRLAEEEPSTFIKYNRGFKEYISIVSESPRTEKTEGILIIGPPGVGKTTFALQQFEGAYFKTCTTGEWWDGYQGEKTVIFDEFKGSIPYQQFTSLVGNQYPIQVQVKGSTKEFNSTLCVFISNFIPDKWYKENYNLLAITRRFGKVIWIQNGSLNNGGNWEYIQETYLSDGNGLAYMKFMIDYEHSPKNLE